MDTDHVLADPQLSSASRSSRSRRDSHSRKHHRDREGGRGSTKSKNPAHRSTRYKEKFQALRERYDRVLAIRDTIEHDLFIATEKMDKIQAENDLLLDAIHTASPELMDLVSRPLLSQSHAQPYPASSSSSHPHLHPPYDPPPPGPQGRFSPAGPPNSRMHEQDIDYDYRYDYDYEMRTSPRVVHVGSRQGQESAATVNMSASPNANGGVNGNGVTTSPGAEPVPAPEAQNNATR